MTSTYFLGLRSSNQARGFGRLFQAALLAVGLTALLFSATTVRANDTIFLVATGGISFAKSEDIRMVEEFLEISTKNVLVKYLFRNESAQDIETTVAFPMPAYDWNSGVRVDKKNIRAITDFTVSVNGLPVSTSNIVEATIKGKNVTKRLREIGLSDAQIASHANCHKDGGANTVLICDLPRSQLNMLMKEFRVDNNPWWYPQWKVNNTIVWKQTFPAGQDVVVEHTYTPFVGMSYTYKDFTGKRFIFPNDLIPVADETDKVCLDSNTRKAMENQMLTAIAEDKDITGAFDFIEEDVEYILGTGRNWKGPIGKFALRIKKETPEQLVSLCFPGNPKKVDNTTIEFSQANFVPQDKLLVYFYTLRHYYTLLH